MDPRQQAILELLQRHGTVQVTRLAAELGVSEVTIRRDLAQLEQEGLVVRFHGGAVLPQAMVPDIPYQEKEGANAEEKRRIATAAAGLVRDGMAIALGAGTTVAAVARALNGRKSLTVVTNAVNIAWEVAHRPDTRLVVTGGVLRESSFCLTGPTAQASLSDLFVDIAFIGVNGLSTVHGLTTPNLDEALIHRTLIERARRAVVVVDHTKFGRVAFSKIADLEQVHTVITDAGAPQEMIQELRQTGLEVLVV